MDNLYSTTFIVDISQNPDEVDTVSSRIQQLIEDHGGIIKKTDLWGKRRLAYPLNKNTHGFYVEIEFSANSRLNIPKILESEYRINDRVLRYMSYAIDKKEIAQRSINAGRAKTDQVKEDTKEEKSTKAEEVSITKETDKNVDFPEVVEKVEESKVEEEVTEREEESDQNDEEKNIEK